MRLPCHPNKFVAVILAACAALSGLWTLNAQTSRSVWDGVFTKEQAARGKSIYGEYCSACHGADLTGIDAALPLAGPAFTSNWDALSVGDLFDRIRISMPADKPGRLSRQQVADVLAYVLSFNDFPSGANELAPQAQILKQIRFDAFKP